ncbi:MAG: TonB-dependent receptor [Verrucomicrobia bacterium]|nr:TonB-dependent receptor [Verrucomicrobiota bacterium]
MSAAEAVRPFQVPAGDALETLRLVARQGGAEIVFLTEVVRGVRTPAVQGEFTMRAALDRLVAGTPLVVSIDSRTGGLSVGRSPTVPAHPTNHAPHDPASRHPTMPPAPSATRKLSIAALFAALFTTSSPAVAQTAAAAKPTGDEAVTLSPFEVRSDQDTGYTATSTLAGSRLNTALRDTPAAISVFTKEFLDDIGAINVTEALVYSLNGAIDTTDNTGNVITSNDLPLQFRGFTGASLGRNYFSWSLSSDSYNIERLDFSRGPNSILFGIGGPGGILNTTTKRARIGKTAETVGLRVASWEDYRGTIDLERTLAPGKLAARVNLLAQDRNGWREFDSMRRLAGALALTYRPLKNTEVRFDGEYGDVRQVVAQPWPAQERYVSWVNAGRVLSPTFGAAAAGTGASTARQPFYDPFSGLGPISLFNSRVTNAGPASPALGNNTAAITDPAILPRNATVSGPGFTSNFFYYNYGLFLEQRLGHLSVELAVNRQTEQRATARPQVFNDTSLYIDPNVQLPSGQPNPNVGKYYTTGRLNVNYLDQIRDDGRATASYELDLRQTHRWLGQHTFAGLWARRENRGHNDTLAEVNTTPSAAFFAPGTAAATIADLTQGANAITRRNTIDFSSSDPAKRGFHDPFKYWLTGQNGVTSGLARITDSTTNDVTRTDSMMAAFQSRLFADRLILTGGLRNDRQRAWLSTADFNGNGSTADERDPVTRLFPKRVRLAKANYSAGDTRTYGVVYHATKQLSLYYNNANNFIPQSSVDINGRLLGNRHGEGEDMGVRVSLLDGRISGSVAYYKTADTNRNVGRDNAFINYINGIWGTLNQPEKSVTTASQDGQDTEGKGWEYDFTANPTPNWRLAVNFAQTRQVTAHIQPNNGAYVDANRALWLRSAALPITATGTGLPANATIGSAVTLIDALYAGFKQAEGQSRRQLREYTGNLFTTYRLPMQLARLNGLTLGAGANYRGKAVTGYDTTRNNAPLYGRPYTLVNAMLSTQLRLKGRQNLRLQLNVDNVLGEDKLIVTDADQIREYRYVFQTPRRWNLTSTLAF